MSKSKLVVRGLRHVCCIRLCLQMGPPSQIGLLFWWSLRLALVPGTKEEKQNIPAPCPRTFLVKLAAAVKLAGGASFSFFLSFLLSVCLSVCLFVCLSVCLSVCLNAPAENLLLANPRVPFRSFPALAHPALFPCTMDSPGGVVRRPGLGRQHDERTKQSHCKRRVCACVFALQANNSVTRHVSRQPGWRYYALALRTGTIHWHYALLCTGAPMHTLHCTARRA